MKRISLIKNGRTVEHRNGLRGTETTGGGRVYGQHVGGFLRYTFVSPDGGRSVAWFDLRGRRWISNVTA